MSHYSIHNLPVEDRPRERLARCGAEALSTVELVAILLGSGTKSCPVLQLAHAIVTRFGCLQALTEATLSELMTIKGVGLAKAIQLKAAFSLGMRTARQTIAPKYRIEHPLHAYHLIKEELERETRELFIVILQDTKGYVICHEVVSIGSLSKTIVHPREVFYPAIRHKAASLIVAHNHPSGDPSPSVQDRELTQTLVEAGRYIGIPVHDHLIVGHGCYVSLRQLGLKFDANELQTQ